MPRDVSGWIAFRMFTMVVLLDCGGKPFEPTSRVIGVILDGKLVLDPRK